MFAFFQEVLVGHIASPLFWSSTAACALTVCSHLQIGADEVSIVASKIKALVHEWAGKRDLVDPAKQVVTAYSPSEGEEISKGEDSQAETSVPDLSEASEQEPQCGDDGCEISWD